MRGRRGLGSPRHAVGINSLRVYRNILHHKQVNVGDAWPKAMRFEKPIVINQVLARELGSITTKPYTKMLVSFQLAGTTNISGVNNLPSANLYVTVKS